MRKYMSMPRELVDGWPTTVERHEAGESAPLHFHQVEEWLEVQQGDVWFYSAGKREEYVGEGAALNIPRGEVHSVQVGPKGVEYRMWVPEQVADETFQQDLDAENLDLIAKNLEVPGAENSKGSPRNPEYFRRFFDQFLSDALTLRTADGAILSKVGFLNRDPGPDVREASDSLQILHRYADSVLISTVVHTRPKEGGDAEGVRQ